MSEAPSTELAGDHSGAPQVGSDYYYASLYFNAKRRQRLALMDAIQREITTIPRTCQDRGVAHIKLAWWREETDYLAAGEARHPLSKALSPALETNPDLLDDLGHLIAQVDASLLPEQFTERHDIYLHLERLLGRWVVQMAIQADPEWHHYADHEQAVFTRLGLQLELGYALRDLRHHRDSPTLYLSQNQLLRHQLNREDIMQSNSSESLRRLIHEELTQLKLELDESLQGVSRARRRAQRALTSLARMQSAAISLTLGDDCHVLERRHDLTPVHKLWFAWRCRWFG